MTILDLISGRRDTIDTSSTAPLKSHRAYWDRDETILSKPGWLPESAKVPKVVSANIFSLDEHGGCR
jgi:hypothetical protein